VKSKEKKIEKERGECDSLSATKRRSQVIILTLQLSWFELVLSESKGIS